MIVFEGCFALVIFPASQAPHKMILLELDALDAYDMLLLRKGVEVPHASMPKPPMPKPAF